MKRLIIFLLFICCWLFGGQIQAFAGKNGSSHQTQKSTSVDKSNDCSEHIIDLISSEDDDEDLVKKYSSAVKYVAAFIYTFIADHTQFSYSPATPGHLHTGIPKYIAQRVLRI